MATKANNNHINGAGIGYDLVYEWFAFQQFTIQFEMLQMSGFRTGY